MPLIHMRGLRTRLAHFIDSLRGRVRNSRDFGGLGLAETERLLRDVGLSLRDMPALTKPRAGPMVLLPQRLDQLGIDIRYLQQADAVSLKDLQRSCLRCASWRSCARDLAIGDAQSGIDSYCLNAPLIDRLVLDRHGRNAAPTGT